MRRIYIMTIREFLARLGINVDNNIADATLQTSNSNEVENIVDSVDNTEIDNTEVENSDIKEDAVDMAVRYPNHNSDTGLFDLDGLDGEALEYFKSINDTVTNKNNQTLIDKAVGDKLSTVKLHRGISADFVRKNLDLSGVSVKDGKVVGVDEAFTTLQKEQAGLFVAEKKESSPLLEGYNPIKGNSYDISGLSITDAMNLQEQGL